MSFINDQYAIIRRRNKDMFYMYLDNGGINYNYYDSNGDIIHQSKLINNKDIDFTKYSFSLDDKDNIYCLYCDKSLQLLKCNNNSYDFYQTESITYNYKKFGLAFPYVKYIEDNGHIFYYVFNNNATNICAIFHHYRHNNSWIENKIDFINHIVLNNFIVLWNQSVPTIFYFNLVNGCEEIFASRFNLGTFVWSTPVQITNSGHNKIYLNVIRDSMNFYHLTFCENEKSGYMVKYISGYLNENKFDLKNSSYLNNPSACMYPSLIKEDTTLYISWVNLNKLFTSTSNDGGLNWCKPVIDEFSTYSDFTRCSFSSNYEGDLKSCVNNVFSSLDNVEILGI